MTNKTGFWAEFRNFAVKGNAFDLAVAVVIGNAFSAVINSLVGDIITPFLGLITNHVDFKTLTWQPYAGLAVKYGAFLQAVFNFFIIALSIFLVFKLISTMRKKLFHRGEDAVPPAEKPAQERLLEEIRDILKGDAKETRV
ncbi:MAG TPA: large conductance mechanosensitive channel protein MscL [Candidatus Paceibacterota bacterium]|nr:large conductance mechanosensitive channel protein MscL [Candidatus Paceibacterota bacterium]